MVQQCLQKVCVSLMVRVSKTEKFYPVPQLNPGARSLRRSLARRSILQNLSEDQSVPQYQEAATRESNAETGRSYIH